MTLSPRQPLVLQQVQLLEGPFQDPRRVDVRLERGRLTAIGDACVLEAQAEGVPVLPASELLLAPALVDPHSELRDPQSGVAERLTSLERSAIAAGYGAMALLPKAIHWRETPEQLQPAQLQSDLQLLWWGSFSRGGEGRELAPHADQLAAGAIGLADGDELPSLALLERGLALAEMGPAPVLLAPRDSRLAQDGFVREGVDALRAGWPMDPPTSESIPLQNLLALAERHPECRLQVMNLSTAAAVDQLRRLEEGRRPEATVCWWHLLADSGSLDPVAEGWRVRPPLGTPADRRALKQALHDGVIRAVAVHHQALDPEEQLLPLDQRQPGVAGHRFVLPALWQELVVKEGWSIRALWQALCFGPAALLNLSPPRLTLGSQHWLLFDPQQRWSAAADPEAPLAANQPYGRSVLTGQVIAAGLNPELWRWGAAEDPLS
jgi:dihydroorotase